MTTSLKKTKKLALYHDGICSFFASTVRKIAEFDLSVEMRNIKFNHQYCTDLHQSGHEERGLCLRVDESNKEIQWLNKHDEIINYLEQQQNELLRLTLTA